jgi:hypothetical protein
MTTSRSSLFLAVVFLSLTTASAQQNTPKPLGDPGPQTGTADLEFAFARQGASFQARLADHPQKVLFVKSQVSDAKAAIANVLLSDVGLNLITMALAPEMRVWNPYMNDSIRKGLDLGKGVLLGHGSETKGFEYETLPGGTAEVTLQEGKAEFYIPLNKYVPSADFDSDHVQPVLVRLDPRDGDDARLISSRQVVLKQNKSGRFDLKPAVERQETGIEQKLVPTIVERLPSNVFKMLPCAPLGKGEYAVVFRKVSDAGEFVQNVALKPVPPAQASPSVQRPAVFGPAAGSPARSTFGALHRGGAPTGAQKSRETEPGMVGFIAWDFRVLK